MTSLLDTTHALFDFAQSPHRSNVPVCRNPDIVYPPSALSSRMQDGRIVVNGSWDKGISGADSCSPIQFTASFGNDGIDLDVVRVDNVCGVHEPVKLKPSMANGLMASLSEHFEELNLAGVDLPQVFERDSKSFTQTTRRNVASVIDHRFNEPIAPCVVVNNEQSVQLKTRVMALGR